MVPTVLALEIRTPDGETRRHRRDAAAGQITIGREAASTIALVVPKCSPRHATIEWSEHGWMLTDTSAHGTDYNGVELRWGERVRLSHGDLLKIGGAELLVTLEEPTGSQPNESSSGTPATPVPTTSHSATPTALAVGTNTEPLAGDPPFPRGPISALDRLMGGPAGDSAPPRLHFFQGGEFVRELPLADEGVSVLVGRDPTCEIAVPDPFRVVSKRHARIYRTWGGVFLEDLSQHGVYLNGERVQNIVALTQGDRVTLSTVAHGSWGPVLVFLEANEAARSEGATAFAAARARSDPSRTAPNLSSSSGGISANSISAGATATAAGAAESQGGAESWSSAPAAQSFAAVSSKLASRSGTGGQKASAGDSSLVVYIALGIAGLALLGLLIAAMLFFGKP